METKINSISIEQLESINVSLANRIRTMGAKLKTRDGFNTSFWVNVEMANGKMYISADNGYDISEDIEVSSKDRTQIKSLINSGP